MGIRVPQPRLHLHPELGQLLLREGAHEVFSPAWADFEVEPAAGSPARIPLRCLPFLPVPEANPEQLAKPDGVWLLRVRTEHRVDGQVLTLILADGREKPVPVLATNLVRR